MEERDNRFTLQPTESRSGIQPGNSVESIVVSSENRNPNWTAQRIFVSTLDLINHTLILLVTIYIVYHSANITENYVVNVHVILCTIGYVLLMSEAILVLAGDSILTRNLSHRATKHLHWVLQAIGLICNLIGVGLMYNAKNAHFRSIHAIIGLSSLVIVCVVTIFGYPVWIAWKLRKFVRPITVKSVHNFLGIVGFVIGIVAQCYGYKKNWFRSTIGVEHADVIAIVLTALIAVLSLRNALISLGRHIVVAFN